MVLLIRIFSFRPVNDVAEVLYKLARCERFYYFQLALIQQIVMDPLTKSGKLCYHFFSYFSLPQSLVIYILI